MANTYTQIYLQFVFAVQNRESLIHTSWKTDLYKYITGIIQNQDHKLLAINGVSNHIHVFINYKVHQSIPQLLQDIKGSSSGWINKNRLARGRFQWQQGYGAFSYSHSQIDNVIKYILNQEKHHEKQTFKEEYQQLLNEFQIDYDDRYVLQDI
jgi:putative transposase